MSPKWPTDGEAREEKVNRSIFQDSYRARDAASDGFKLMGLGAMAWAFIVILSIAGLAVSLYVQPWAIARERENVIQSNAWVQTQVTALVDFQSSYSALDARIADFKDDPKNAELVKGLRAQQAGLVRQMRQKVAELPPSKVPADTRTFLALHQ